MDTKGALSPLTIRALVDVITGGPSGSTVAPIGVYRSATNLEQFFADTNTSFRVGVSSRVSAVRDLLIELNRADDGLERLTTISEAVSDPRQYGAEVEKADAVAQHLNSRLVSDGFSLTRVGDRYRLTALATNALVADAFRGATATLDFASVQRDFERAVAEAERDPEDAITAACATLESVCKTLLDEMGVARPARQDVAGLVKEVQRHLDLSPGRPDLDADVRQILSGLTTVTGGVGSLRTHGGDAHGHGRGVARLDSRFARLAIHAASTVSLFLIESWRQRTI